MTDHPPQTPADVPGLLAEARHLMRPRRGEHCSAECLGQCEDCRLIARVDAALRARVAPEKFEPGKYGFDRQGDCGCSWSSATHADLCPEHGGRARVAQPGEAPAAKLRSPGWHGYRAGTPEAPLADEPGEAQAADPFAAIDALAPSLPVSGEAPAAGDNAAQRASVLARSIAATAIKRSPGGNIDVNGGGRGMTFDSTGRHLESDIEWMRSIVAALIDKGIAMHAPASPPDRGGLAERIAALEEVLRPLAEAAEEAADAYAPDHPRHNTKIPVDFEDLERAREAMCVAHTPAPDAGQAEAGRWYIIVDRRTGKQACSGVWSSELAEAKIREFQDRQRKGGRPDITAEDVANLAIRPAPASPPDRGGLATESTEGMRVASWRARGWQVITESNPHRPLSERWSCEVLDGSEQHALPRGLGYVCGYGATEPDAVMDAEWKLMSEVPTSPAPDAGQAGAEPMAWAAYPPASKWDEYDYRIFADAESARQHAESDVEGVEDGEVVPLFPAPTPTPRREER